MENIVTFLTQRPRKTTGNTLCLAISDSRHKRLQESATFFGAAITYFLIHFLARCRWSHI